MIENKAEEIFARHWRLKTGKELDEATKSHLQYAVDAVNEALVCRVDEVFPDKDLMLEQTKNPIINQVDSLMAKGYIMGFADCYDWIKKVIKLKEYQDVQSNRGSTCLCLHEIENNLPRTKLCFIACEAQRRELREREMAIERIFPVSKVIYFKHKNGKYLCANGEVTTDMIMNYEHSIFGDGGYLILK